MTHNVSDRGPPTDGALWRPAKRLTEMDRGELEQWRASQPGSPEEQMTVFIQELSKELREQRVYIDRGPRTLVADRDRHGRRVLRTGSRDPHQDRALRELWLGRAEIDDEIRRDRALLVQRITDAKEQASIALAIWAETGELPDSIRTRAFVLGLDGRGEDLPDSVLVDPSAMDRTHLAWWIALHDYRAQIRDALRDRYRKATHEG